MKKYCVTVKYQKIVEETGMGKADKTILLISAVSFTDAEAKANTYMENLVKAGVCSGTFEVDAMAKKDYSEVIESSEDLEEYKYFDAKVIMHIYDESKEREVKQTITYLVESDDFDNALASIKKHLESQDDKMEFSKLEKSKVTEIILN